MPLAPPVGTPISLAVGPNILRMMAGSVVADRKPCLTAGVLSARQGNTGSPVAAMASA